jgi:hypothetical protein
MPPRWTCSAQYSSAKAGAARFSGADPALQLLNTALQRIPILTQQRHGLHIAALVAADGARMVTRRSQPLLLTADTLILVRQRMVVVGADGYPGAGSFTVSTFSRLQRGLR